ncbi:MAG TPA: pentapeptide repeat-containing protein [Trebonia sp.]|jgi:hypothetical protein|nr:pentapeptide repeat-containing protein [Trebonia sp.]
MPEESPYRAELTADCARCFGLCCVAPGFAASGDFAISKPAGAPCPNLGDDFRCRIHDRLRPSGFTGCTVFDCYGAGQKVAQVTFSGTDWRRDPGLARPMFAAFAVMRQLHELMWYLDQARSLPPAAPVRAEATAALAELSRLTRLGPAELATADLGPARERAGAALRRAGQLVRAAVLGCFLDRAGEPLGGGDLARAAGLSPATLGAVLGRLVREQSVSAREAAAPSEAGAPRPVYVLTAQGAQRARDEASALEGSRQPGRPPRPR